MSRTIPAAAYLTAGRIAEAAAEVDKGLAQVVEGQARGYRGPLLRLWAEVLMQQEPLSAVAAGERLREALALTTELGMRLEIARCRLSLARLHGRIDGRARGESQFLVECLAEVSVLETQSAALLTAA